MSSIRTYKRILPEAAEVCMRYTGHRAVCTSDWTRSDTPGTSAATHFNAAGTALPTRQVCTVKHSSSEHFVPQK